MKSLMEIFAGLVLLLIPIYLWITDYWGFGDAALDLLKGGIIWVLILIGAILLVVGISDLRD